MSDMRNIERERYLLLPAGDVTFTEGNQERSGGGNKRFLFLLPPIPSRSFGELSILRYGVGGGVLIDGLDGNQSMFRAIQGRGQGEAGRRRDLSMSDMRNILIGTCRRN
jgi:hypothetical protein